MIVIGRLTTPHYSLSRPRRFHRGQSAGSCLIIGDRCNGIEVEMEVETGSVTAVAYSKVKAYPMPLPDSLPTWPVVKTPLLSLACRVAVSFKYMLYLLHQQKKETKGKSHAPLHLIHPYLWL